MYCETEHNSDHSVRSLDFSYNFDFLVYSVLLICLVLDFDTSFWTSVRSDIIQANAL